MVCSKWLSIEKAFLYVNYIFAMYAGSLLVTAARLGLDPTTYSWFRFLLEAQYKVTVGYLYALGVFQVVLVFLGSSAVFPTARRRIQAYMAGTVLVICSEVTYGSWMFCSLQAWWGASSQAELLRTGLALQDDVKALLAVLQKHHQVVEEVNNAVHEVELDAPKNGYVICAGLVVSVVLQVAALVLCWLLQRRSSLMKQREDSQDWGQSNRLLYSTSTSKRNRSLDLPDI